MVSRIPSSKTTLADIARRAGVSTATASRVLNGTGPTSPGAQAAIFEAASLLGYRRADEMAKAVPSSSVGSVEIIWHWNSPYDTVRVDSSGYPSVGPRVDVRPVARELPRGFGHSFFQDILNGLLGELGRCGRKASVQANRDLTDPAFLADLNATGHDGAVLLGEFDAGVDAFVAACRIPLVLADQKAKGGAHIVTIDNITGVQETVDHLIGLGHRRIGFLCGAENDPAFALRKRAWTWRMLESGLSVRPEWTGGSDGGVAHSEAAARAILTRANRPTAILCANDNLAIGVYRAAAGLGLSIPRDLSVAGFDDIDISSLLSPALTTVHVPAARIGQLAIRMLLAEIGAPRLPDDPGIQTVVNTRFLPRASTGPMPSSPSRNKK